MSVDAMKLKQQAGKKVSEKSAMIKWMTFLIPIAVGAAIWSITPPEGVKPEAWHLLAIFIATIVGLIAKPFPMSTVALLSLTVAMLTQTLDLKQGLSGFSNDTIWLVVIAFFISRGFIKTGLGNRIAYLFVKRFGKKTLGLAYAILGADLILAPAMPSATARGGGILLPIVRSLAESYGSRPEDGTENKIGAFLMKVTYQGDMVAATIFLTAGAGNLLAASLAKEIIGTPITWMQWFIAAVVPGLIGLALLPILLYKLMKPEIKETPNAAIMANEKLKEMGPLKKSEKSMLGVFFLVLTLWIVGESYLDIDSTVTAFIGLSALLLSNVLTMDDIKNESSAWNTFIWFAILVMMAGFLNKFGLIAWFSGAMKGAVSGMSWMAALGILALVYFYSHYFFASISAHITAMYSAFLAVAVAAGAPGMMAALILAYFSHLFSCTTHYGAGPAPVFFGTGYLTQNRWWNIGFILSIFHIVMWGIVGSIWWKVIGLW